MWAACIFFFNDTATTEIYTLSLHDALPIYPAGQPARGHLRDRVGRTARGGDGQRGGRGRPPRRRVRPGLHRRGGRKSTRLKPRHANISYAVFFLQKKTAILPLRPRRPALPT